MQNTALRSGPRQWFVAIAFYLCSFFAAIGAGLMLHKDRAGSLASLSNFMGSLVESLIHGGGYVVCSDGMTAPGNILCFHANHMPLPPFLLAGLAHIFGDQYRWVELAKVAIVLIPVAAAVSLVWSAAYATTSRKLRGLILFLLFASLLIPIQLIDVLNMQVEEGYTFCLLAYALAILLFGMRSHAHKRFIPWSLTFAFAIATLALYLTKSSMIVASVFLVLAFCWQAHDFRKNISIILIFLCGPLIWGLYTYRTGHLSLGSSIDGMNLHKGNCFEFLANYPPPAGRNFDRYDAKLNEGEHFKDEWTFNAYHFHAAERYVESHPAQTLQATFWKAEVFFISLRKIGSETYSGWLAWLTDLSMVLFRLLFWTACAVALWLLAHPQRFGRRAAMLYLGVVGAVALPYLIGYALTRHAGVLIVPSAIFLSWWILERFRLTKRPPGTSIARPIRTIHVAAPALSSTPTL